MLTKRDLVRGLVSSLTSSLGLWRGTSVIRRNIGKAQPKKLIKLYDMEGCPHCRLVREALTELDLDVTIIPVAKGDAEARQGLLALGGLLQVPFLVDENADTSLYESYDIVNYLYAQYGNGKARTLMEHKVATASAIAATFSRFGSGLNYSPSIKPLKPLELFSFESSPFSRPVRERLTELGISYTLRNLGKQQMSDMGPPEFRFTTKPYVPMPGTKREAMYAKTGRVQVPYLIDPNTNTELFESWDIIEHLNKNYSAHAEI